MSARRESVSPLRRTLLIAIGTVLWLAAILLIVQSGWLQGEQRRLLFFAAAMNAASLSVGLSPLGRWLSLLPLPALVAFQGFRLPLELVLHSWVAQGVIPATMTWSGRNWDVITGLVALIAAPFCRRSIIWAWIANGVGRYAGRRLVVARFFRLAGRAQARTHLSRSVRAYRAGLHRWRNDRPRCAHSRSAATRAALAGRLASQSAHAASCQLQLGVHSCPLPKAFANLSRPEKSARSSPAPGERTL